MCCFHLFHSIFHHLILAPTINTEIGCILDIIAAHKLRVVPEYTLNSRQTYLDWVVISDGIQGIKAMGGSPELMWPQLLWPVWRATVPPMFHLKSITTKTNMPLRKTWRNSTAWSLMNQEKMMLKLLECFCHDIRLFLKMENQLLRFWILHCQIGAERPRLNLQGDWR